MSDNKIRIPKKDFPNQPLPSTGFINDSTAHLLFSFKFLKKKEISKLQPKECQKIILKIKQLETLTWKQIESDSYANGNGYETIKLDDLKINLENPPNDDKVMIFRYSKRGRIIGFKEDTIFYILHIDANHKAY